MRDYYLQNLGIGQIWKERTVAQPASVAPVREFPEQIANESLENSPLGLSVAKNPAVNVSELHRQIGECHQCSLCSSNGRANLQATDAADVLIITGLFAPVQLDEQERLMTNMMSAFPLDKTTRIYRTALLKARSRGESDEMLEQPAIDSCVSFLKQEIALFRPKLLIVFGDIIWKSLRGKAELSEELPIPSNRILYQGIPVMVIDSLNAILEQPILKKLAWRQFASLKEHSM